MCTSVPWSTFPPSELRGSRAVVLDALVSVKCDDYRKSARGGIASASLFGTVGLEPEERAEPAGFRPATRLAGVGYPVIHPDLFPILVLGGDIRGTKQPHDFLLGCFAFTNLRSDRTVGKRVALNRGVLRGRRRLPTRCAAVAAHDQTSNDTDYSECVSSSSHLVFLSLLRPNVILTIRWSRARSARVHRYGPEICSVASASFISE